ncbi:hypothetical protein COP2_027215 [Malus domestica]
MEMILKKISGLGYLCSSHKKRIATLGLRVQVCIGYRIVMDWFKAWLMIVSDLDHTILPMPKPPTKWKLFPKQKVEQKYLQDPHFFNGAVMVFVNCYLQRL